MQPSKKGFSFTSPPPETPFVDRRKEPIVKFKTFICEEASLEKELNERIDISNVIHIFHRGSAVHVLYEVSR